MDKLKSLFLNSIPETPYNVETFPYRKYLKDHRKEGYNDLIKQLIHKNTPLTLRKKEVLEKILADCEAIYLSLLPLYNLGMHFSLALAGGAVRDLLLDREDKIKDLDIILSICPYKINIPTPAELLKTWDFDIKKHPWKEYKSVRASINNGIYRKRYKTAVMTQYDKIYEIVKFIMAKSHHYENCFPPFKTNSEKTDDNDINTMPSESEYISRSLNGVLKINTPNLNYPADILITNKSIIGFIDMFDFNICKASILLVNELSTKQKSFDFPKNSIDLLHRFMPQTLFLQDVATKTITLDSDNRNPGDIQRSLDSHLQRITNKFSDFKLDLKVDQHDAFYKEKTIIINHYLFEKKLSISDKKTKTLIKI